MRDDLSNHVGILIRLQTMVEVEARRLGIDIEKNSHAITDRLRDYKNKEEANDAKDRN